MTLKERNRQTVFDEIHSFIPTLSESKVYLKSTSGFLRMAKSPDEDIILMGHNNNLELLELCQYIQDNSNEPIVIDNW